MIFSSTALQTQTRTNSYLIFGVAEQLLLGLHEANCGDRARVPAERTNWF